MKIQKFSTFDETKDLYRDKISKTADAIQQANNEYQQSLNDYNVNYDKQLNEYNDLQNKQQNYINDYAKNQTEVQQKQTDYNVGLVNKNKQQAAKDTASETGEAYMDYMRNINQYGGNAEQRATNGISNAGVSDSIKASYNIAFQNRIGTAKAALLKTNTDYDNQIQQALLTNDAKLAEIALNKMQQSYQLILSGFEFKNNMYKDRINYNQTLNNTYYSRKNDLQNRIDNYQNTISEIDKYQDEAAEKRKEQAESNRQWWTNFNENKRQFNQKMAEDRRQFDTQYGDNDFDESKKVTSTYTPFLSSKTAMEWFNNGLSREAVSEDGIKTSKLKSELSTAYKNGVINKSDLAKILKSFNVK